MSLLRAAIVIPLLHIACVVPASSQPVLAKVEKRLIKPYPRIGAANWVSDRYVGPNGERMEVHSTEVEGRDDVHLQRFARWSLDHGRTWGEPRALPDTEHKINGVSIWEGGGAEVYDPASRSLVRLWLRQIQQGGLYHCFTYWQRSIDLGRSWSAPVQLCYEPRIDFNEKDPLNPAFLRVNQGYFGNNILRRKDGALVTTLAHANAQGDPNNATRPWRMGSVLFMGRWNTASRTYDWKPQARVECTPQMSGRGLMEPAVTELKDGRLLVVWRQDSTEQTPGCKLVSISRDGGRTLTHPEPWRYDTGQQFYSPSSIHQFLRHSRTGKLYWIGNLCPQPPSHNSPRYPLVIGEVDETRASLIKSTVSVIDDRQPHQSANLQLSNFSVLENRETGEIEIKLALFGEHEGKSVYTGNAYVYHLKLRGDRNAIARPKPHWKAGLARAVITPTESVWMSGYAGKREAFGKRHDLWVKALALQDPKGRTGVLITSDLIGFSGAEYRAILALLRDRFGLRQDQVLLSFSHTHTGPIQAGSLLDYFPIDPQQESTIRAYSQRLRNLIVETCGKALSDLQPALLDTTRDSSTFGVNRRENREADVAAIRSRNEPLKGPVDHSVPVLLVRRADTGALRSLIFGYACHATTLADTEWSGDYPGFAQAMIEQERPGVQAMFWAGCGADQNPLPRRTVELCKDYGKQLIDAVNRSLSNPYRSLEPELGTVAETIQLPFESVVGTDVLEREAGHDTMRARWAARLLAKRQQGEPEASAKDYPYTVVLWKLGDQTLVALAGEVVVDYALRLKRELGEAAWVMAYVNDLVAYIPSERVLKEGGYEGIGVYEYGHPGERWQTGIEERILLAVNRLRRQLNSRL